MRIFVTGASGFIGRNLLPLLDCHEILCLNHSAHTGIYSTAQRTIRGDLNTSTSYSDELERFQPECCIHLAWGGHPDYSFQNCRTNLFASTDLFDVLGRLGCGKIFAVGSCWEYGARTGAMKERDQGVDLSLFAAHKTALQLIGQSNCAATGSRLTWGRVFFVFGPGQRPNSLIPSCFRSLKHGEAPKINSPLAINDFIHVADVAGAIRKLIENDDATGTYNIGSGRPFAVWEVVNLVAAEMGLAPVYHDMPPSTEGIWADISRIGLLDWQPELSLQVGISQTISMLTADQ
jgi:nucleoside-diphosphate-sugar epimerase